MFLNAQSKIKVWTIPARVNKGMTKGTAFNLLSKGVVIGKEWGWIAKRNMIWEFGEYLPGYTKKVAKEKPSPVKLVHQEPKFI